MAGGAGHHGSAVSIHAPTRGATPHRCRFGPSPIVSIHAPTRGANGTAETDADADGAYCFNPRTHAGCDLVVADAATLHSFNPRTHAGCDNGFGFRALAPFQSTHPRGVRPLALNSFSVTARFNPRTHAGCDWPSRLAASPMLRFQSTHPRGVRHEAPSIHDRFQSTHPRGVHPGFNPRTHAGCDQIGRIFGVAARSFNPRTHAGCDAIHDPAPELTRFQSTHPRGVRQQHFLNGRAGYSRFNPRTHAGCDQLAFCVFSLD